MGDIGLELAPRKSEAIAFARTSKNNEITVEVNETKVVSDANINYLGKFYVTHNTLESQQEKQIKLSITHENVYKRK